MRKATIIYLLGLLGISLIVCSYAGGATSHNIEGTGAETGLGNSAGCGQGCHTLGTTTTISIELDSAGVPTTQYVGGMTYTVKLTGKNTSTTSLPKFGFQIGCIVGSAAATTPVNAGSWVAPYPTKTTYVAPKAGKFVVGIIEQTSAITATSGTGGNGTTYVETFNWKAPVAGTGTISFWAVLNAVNGNNNDTGDKYNTGHVSITELVPTAPLKATTTVVNVKCNGDKTGSATAAVSGGTTPYTYSWNSSPVQTTATATNLSAGSYTVTVKDAVGATTTSVATISQPTAIAINTSPTNASSCTAADGSITSSVSGGTPPYTYAWNNGKTTSGISGLATGTYSLTVTDANSCKQQATATVSCGTAALTVNVSGTNVKCFGGNDGTATANASGGTTPYTYLWNSTPSQTTPVATGLSSGTYTVTVTDAKGGTKSASVTLTAPNDIVANSTVVPVSSCSANDGSVSVNCSGGTAPYAYLWNNGNTTNSITNLAVGNYSVKITDANGCIKNATSAVNLSGVITIELSNPLVEGFENSTDFPAGWTLDNPDGDASWQIVTTLAHTGSNCIGFDNCDGNGIGADMTGSKDRFITNAYDFTNVTAKSSLSFDLAYAVLSYKNKTLSDSLAIYASTDCGSTWDLLYLKGGSELSGITTSISCWTPTDADWRSENISLSNFAGKPNVTFAFENRSNWGEWIYLDNINITAVTGIETINPLANFTIYPNPASSFFSIEGTAAGKIQYVLYDMIGKQVKQGSFETNGALFNRKIAVDDLNPGIYFVKFGDGKNTWAEKLTLQ